MSRARVIAPAGVEAAQSTLVVPTNGLGDLHFLRREHLAEFARVNSERVAAMLEVLSGQENDGMLSLALDAMADLAYQVHCAIGVLVDAEGGAQ